MSVTLRSLETAVPATALRQETVRDVLAAQPDLSRLGKRLVSTAFDSSGIEHRYSALTEWGPARRGRAGVLRRRAASQPHHRGPQPGVRAGGDAALRRSPRRSRGGRDQAADVTHVITVSCRVLRPRADYRIARPRPDPSVQRYHLGFMGCYAALPALRQAQTICRADPEAVVIVASVELCTLHVRTSNDPDTIVGSSLFADGAAAAVVTGRDFSASTPLLRLDHFETVLTPVGEEAMAWNIGDNGFEMVLGTYVPHIIDEHITGALEPLLAHEPALADLPFREIPHWAIHPGGRSILDKVEAKLALDPAQLVPARETLRDFGNMSSATVMFVLQKILRAATPGAQEAVCSMAFGPGLTVETALLTVIGSAGSSRPRAPGPDAGRSERRDPSCADRPRHHHRADGRPAATRTGWPAPTAPSVP